MAALNLLPFVVPTVADALSGPSATKAASTADQVIKIAQAVTGIADPEKAAAAVAANHEFQLKMMQMSSSIQVAEIQETNATARVEAQSTDEYVRRTRPMMARMSFVAGMIYMGATSLIFPVVNAVYATMLPGPSEWLVTALFSPLLAYIGARSFGFDKRV